MRMNRKDTQLLVENWRRLINEDILNKGLNTKQDGRNFFADQKEVLIKKLGDDSISVEKGNHSCYEVKNFDNRSLKSLKPGQMAYNNDGQQRGLFFAMSNNDNETKIYFIQQTKVDFHYQKNRETENSGIMRIRRHFEDLGFEDLSGKLTS